jgi:hypothetical protein
MAGTATRAAATSTTVAKFRNLRRGSFMVMPRELEHLPRHSINHIQQPPECPLLAQSGHHAAEFQCLLWGVKRTLCGPHAMSAFDPKRTLRTTGSYRRRNNNHRRRPADVDQRGGDRRHPHGAALRGRCT